MIRGEKLLTNNYQVVITICDLKEVWNTRTIKIAFDWRNVRICGKYVWINIEVVIAIATASTASGTGNPLMKIGTRIPPPVHANTILTNLKLSGASGFILLNTLFPIRQKSNKRQRKVRNACPNNTFIVYLPDISNILTVKEGISKQTQVSLHCANTMVLAMTQARNVVEQFFLLLSSKVRNTDLQLLVYGIK